LVVFGTPIVMGLCAVFLAVARRTKSDEVLRVLVLPLMVLVVNYQIATTLAHLVVPVIIGFTHAVRLSEALVVLVGVLTHCA